MKKVSGELYDLYFLLKQDEAQTSALMAEKSERMSRAEVVERYQHALDIQEREQAALWAAICKRYGLDPMRRYLLTRAGEVVQLQDHQGEALAV